MADSGTKLKVGITFLLAVAILLAGILWLKEYRPGSGTVPMRVEFGDSGGIGAGAPVEVSGVRVGLVTDVSLTPENRALVRFTVNRSVHLHPDARFQVRDTSLMGDKALVISPGTAPGELDRNEVRKGAPAESMNGLFADADSVLQHLKSISAQVDRGLNLARLTGEYEVTLGKVRQLVSVYSAIAAENRVPLKRAVSGMNTVSSDLQRFVQTSDSSAAFALESFRRASDDLSRLVVSLQPFATVADTMAVSLRSGNGTLARLVRSQELYDNLHRTSASIDSLLTDLKRNPGKYTKNMKFRISLF